MLKWNFFFLRVLYFCIACLLSFFAIANQREPGGLRVQCNARDASVLANGFFVGKSKEVIYLPAGKSINLTITAPGFFPQQMTIELKVNQVRELRVELKKMNNNNGVEDNDYGSVRGLPKPKKTTVDFSGGEGVDPTVDGPQYNAPFSGEEDSTFLKSTMDFTVKISPFGIPQFAKGEVGFGVLAASAQALSLGTSFYYYWIGGRYKDTANQELARIKDPAAWDSYRQKSDAYLQDLYNKQLIYLGVFALAWSLSIFDAFRNPPQYSKPKIGFWGVPYGSQFAWGSHVQYEF